jgi:thymidylate synthase (FAD)
MKLIKPSAELLIQGPGLEGIYKQIELAGRTCYKSTDKITKDSAKPFVDRMVKSNHTAMLEHGTVYLKIPNHGVKDAPEDCIESWTRYENNPYSKCCEIPYNDPYELFVTTNFRVVQENGWLDDLKYLCEPTEYHEKRYTFKVNTSIGVTREFNRHRVNSIAEQSTRYCNYSKDKFGNEITFISPVWDITLKPDSYGEDLSYTFFLNEVEILYKHLTNDCGWSAQQAREVLPLCTATEAVYTAFESDWKHFFDLRLRGTTGKPHPNMQELAELMHEQLKQKGIEL